MKRIEIYKVKLVRESAGLYNIENKILKNPEVVNKVIREVFHLEEEAIEQFGIITLDVKNKIIGMHPISSGSLSAGIVHPREVFKPAILNNASAIILFHNHPSYDPTPSPEDIATTVRLIEAGSLLGIKILDHLVIGGNTYYSMNERGSVNFNEKQICV